MRMIKSIRLRLKGHIARKGKHICKKLERIKSLGGHRRRLEFNTKWTLKK
jgi:hypothetical protein